MEIATRTGVLSDLLWDLFKEVALGYRSVLWKRFGPWQILNRVFLTELAIALLVEIALRAFTCSGREIFAHLMVAGHILTGRWILKAGRVLERRLWDVTLEKRCALLYWTKLCVDRAFNDILRISVRIIILWPWIISRIQVSAIQCARAETLWLGIKHRFVLWGSRNICKGIND